MSKSVHTYSDREKSAFVNFLNSALSTDLVIKEAGYIPIDPKTD